MPGRFTHAECVYFDVDDTLYDFNLSVRLTLRQLQSEYPDVLGGFDARELEQRYYAANRAMSEKLRLALIAKDSFLYRRATWDLLLARQDRGSLPADTFCVGDTSRFLEDAPRGDLPARLAERFAEWRFANLQQAAFPRALDTLRDLMDAGRTVGIITNGPATFQRAKCDALGLHDMIRDDLVLVSEEFGARKPHPSIFREAAKRANVSPEDVVYVGDSVECDVASKGTGMRFIWFDAARRPRPDFKGVCGFEPDAVAHDYDAVRAYLGV